MATKREVVNATMNGYGALGRAAADEPVFVLRARDTFAPGVVETWCARVNGEMLRMDRLDPKFTQLGEKIMEARALAHEMRAWQERNGSKVPD